jgi:hypothetical protein
VLVVCPFPKSHDHDVISPVDRSVKKTIVDPLQTVGLPTKSACGGGINVGIGVGERVEVGTGVALTIGVSHGVGVGVDACSEQAEKTRNPANNPSIRIA